MAEDFLSRSFLFEIVDSETEKIEASFTLVLPPRSYSIKEKHRVSITKTFGNAFIDDYGPDNLEMTIEGISGTAHAFPTFTSTGSSAGSGVVSGNVSGEGYRHREAFYVFRDTIMRYRDKVNFDQKEMRVYDLFDEQVYKCVLLEFSLNRKAEQPFWYPFSIQLFVYAKVGSASKGVAIQAAQGGNRPSFTPKKIQIAKDPTAALDSMDAGVESLDEQFKIFENIQQIKNTIGRFQNNLRLLRARLNTFLTRVRDVVETPLTLARTMIDIATELAGFVYDAYTQGKIAIESYVNATETINAQIREALALYGFAISQGSVQSSEETIESYDGMNYDDPSNPAPVSNIQRFSFNGLNTYTVRGTDTLQRIAQEQLGDSSQWPYIAAVNNNITSNDDLVVGSEIYIPVEVSSNALNKDSFIITEDNRRNPYGTDIRIDDNGDIVIQENNDVALISGVENVIQAIDIRLQTSSGSMIKQTAFGLLAQPGLPGTETALRYTRISLTDALLKDPRIESVSNLSVTADGDTLTASADIQLVGRDSTLPVTVVV